MLATPLVPFALRADRSRQTVGVGVSAGDGSGASGGDGAAGAHAPAQGRLPEHSALEPALRRSPALMLAVRGPAHVVTWANDAFCALAADDAPVGRPAAEVLPALGAALGDALTAVRALDADAGPHRLDGVRLALPARATRGAAAGVPDGAPNGAPNDVPDGPSPGAPTADVATVLRHVDLVLAPLPATGGAPAGVLLQGVDVTPQVRAADALRESEAHFRGILEAVHACAVCIDLAGRATFVNDYALRLAGWRHDERTADAWWRRFFVEPELGLQVVAEAMAGAGAAARVEAAFPGADGVPRLFEWDVLPLHDDAGQVSGAALLGHDVTERRRAEATLRERAALAERDELTGLLNRRGFLACAEQRLAQARRDGQPCLLLYGDLDDFKGINDVHGHAAGDLALQAVAGALRDALRDGDVVARLGGDEFTVLAPGCTAADLPALRARVRAALAERGSGAGHPWRLGMSLGARVADPAAGESLATLLDAADAALYAEKQARRAGRGSGGR